MKNTIIISLLALVSLAFASCSTMEGVGRDMQSAGAALSTSAQR